MLLAERVARGSRSNGAGYDRMAEAQREGARRPPPERAGEDDRVCLLGAAEAGRAGLHAASLDELTEDVTPRRFGMREVLERVEQHGDLFEPVLAGGQALGRAMEKLRD